MPASDLEPEMIEIPMMTEKGERLKPIRIPRGSTDVHIREADITEPDRDPTSGSVDVPAGERAIIDLTGLSEAENLISLRITTPMLGNLDLSPLSECRNLREFTIRSPRGPEEKIVIGDILDLSWMSKNTKMRSIEISDATVKKIILPSKSQWAGLKTFSIDHTLLEEIDLSCLSPCVDLYALSLEHNKLESLVLPVMDQPNKIKDLSLLSNRLADLDLGPVSTWENLVKIELEENLLTHINLAPLSSCPLLRNLNLSRNRLKSLDLSPLAKMRKIASIRINSNNELDQLSAYPLSHVRNLTWTSMLGTAIEELDVSPLLLTGTSPTVRIPSDLRKKALKILKPLHYMASSVQKKPLFTTEDYSVKLEEVPWDQLRYLLAAFTKRVPEGVMAAVFRGFISELELSPWEGLYSDLVALLPELSAEMTYTQIRKRISDEYPQSLTAPTTREKRSGEIPAYEDCEIRYEALRRTEAKGKNWLTIPPIASLDFVVDTTEAGEVLVFRSLRMRDEGRSPPYTLPKKKSVKLEAMLAALADVQDPLVPRVLVSLLNSTLDRMKEPVHWWAKIAGGYDHFVSKYVEAVVLKWITESMTKRHSKETVRPLIRTLSIVFSYKLYEWDEPEVGDVRAIVKSITKILDEYDLRGEVERIHNILNSKTELPGDIKSLVSQLVSKYEQ